MQNENNEEGKRPLNPPNGPAGHASNPLADDEMVSGGPEGLLDERADKYIREVAPIEDYPDDQDMQDMNQVIEDEQGSDEEAGSKI